MAYSRAGQDDDSFVVAVEWYQNDNRNNRPLGISPEGVSGDGSTPVWADDRAPESALIWLSHFLVFVPENPCRPRAS